MIKMVRLKACGKTCFFTQSSFFLAAHMNCEDNVKTWNIQLSVSDAAGEVETGHD